MTIILERAKSTFPRGLGAVPRGFFNRLNPVGPEPIMPVAVNFSPGASSAVSAPVSVASTSTSSTVSAPVSVPSTSTTVAVGSPSWPRRHHRGNAQQWASQQDGNGSSSQTPSDSTALLASTPLAAAATTADATPATTPASWWDGTTSIGGYAVSNTSMVIGGVFALGLAYVFFKKR
jgi:hypothetical protein